MHKHTDALADCKMDNAVKIFCHYLYLVTKLTFKLFV